MRRFLVAFLFLPLTATAQDALLIDPLMLVELREARSAAAALDIFPGWDFHKAPVLLYRPGVQDVLLNHPDVPAGFTRYTGPSPLGDEPIWVRNDSTEFDLDGQNTATELHGLWTLVVADPASALRNRLRTFTGMAKEQQDEWLEQWSFLGSPYDVITMMLHEGFHVHQYEQSDKFANETLIARYPLYDAENGALHELEGRILLAAARGETTPEDALRHFASVRTVRHAALGADLSGYELANEFSEGLAKYVEYRFYQSGSSLVPHAEMFLVAGFDGYGRLKERFEQQLGFAEHIIGGDIAVNNDRFGAGNLRFRLYPMGALQGLLLDRVVPGWTQRIFEPEVFPSTLLVDAAGISTDEATEVLGDAKTQYGYEAILAEKQAYESEGRAAALEKLEALRGTDQTLVRISWGGLSQDAPGLGFTPFGVTPLGDGRAIYDLVPISAVFGEDARLELRVVTPVLVDPDRRELEFSVPVTPEDIVVQDGAIRTDAFVLSRLAASVSVEGRRVRIELE